MKRIILYIGLLLVATTIVAQAWFMGPGRGPGQIGSTFPAVVSGGGPAAGDGLLLEAADFLILETGDYLLLE